MQLSKAQGLTAKCLVENVKRINTAFPSLTKGFYILFIEAIKQYRLSDTELTSAVKHVIFTGKYPTPKISDFILFVRPNGDEDVPQNIEPPTQEDIDRQESEYQEWVEKNKDDNDRFFKIGKYAVPEEKELDQDEIEEMLKKRK